MFTAWLVSRTLGLGLSVSFTECVPQHTRKQARPCVTAVGKFTHWRHKPLRNNVWSSLLTEELVSMSRFKVLIPGLKHVVIQNWSYSARNSCSGSNRGLTFPPVTPSYCWNLPLPSDRTNKREHVGSSSSRVQNINICWFWWLFGLIFSLWTTLSPEQICCQFSDSSSRAITSSRRDGQRVRNSDLHPPWIARPQEVRWAASLWQWITILQEKLSDEGIKILNFHELV